ncbi:MAG TPA: hypothetical protein DCM86_19985 [Verrucomicrobiales bacterium]|nr:hypothetical protein [Verrucomicrobiales bacterium]
MNPEDASSRMSRRGFLRAGALMGTLPPLLGLPGSGLVLPSSASAAFPAPVRSRLVPSGNIRDYLSREAGRITDRALPAPLRGVAWDRGAAERRREFREMMGIDGWWTERRDPPRVVVTGRVERERYSIEKLYFEPLPHVFITANLYLPKGTAGPAPGVLYVCGHAHDQKVYYQAHPRRFAELGFVCLIVETIEAAELGGTHHGCYREGWWNWYSRGYTPAGIELLNGIRALDLLEQRPEVDPSRLGVTGISGGGAASWWIAAADPRVKVAAPVCGTATLFSHVHDRTIDGHCDCMWWINSYRWDLADVGGLIAPRPLLIGSADKDGIFTIESIRRVHSQLEGLYRSLGARDRIRLVETPGGHSYHARSRTEIFSWFSKHLQGREVSAATIGDIDERPDAQESAETLRVFVHGPPPGNRVTRVQDGFFVPPGHPEIRDAASLLQERERVVARLRRVTFGAFPSEPPPLDLQVEQEFEEDASGFRFGYTSEEGWRLHGQLLYRKPAAGRAPVVVGLRSPGERRGETRGFLLRLAVPWLRVECEPRGTGETSWGEDLQWHVRRAAAWTGRTLASMRVWDVLRSLEAARRLPQVDPARVALAARGEMCVPALYAALLDGRVGTLLLQDPPATLDLPGEKDGRGPAMEMLNVLRVADLVQAAGLLWPTELVLAGSVPEGYAEVERVYSRAGLPGRVTRVGETGEWRPGEGG